MDIDTSIYSSQCYSLLVDTQNNEKHEKQNQIILSYNKRGNFLSLSFLDANRNGWKI